MTDTPTEPSGVDLLERPWYCSLCQHSGYIVAPSNLDVLSTTRRIMADHAATCGECLATVEEIVSLGDLTRPFGAGDPIKVGKLILEPGEVLVLQCPPEWSMEWVQSFWHNFAQMLASAVVSPPLVIALGGGVSIEAAKLSGDLYEQVVAQVTARILVKLAEHGQGVPVARVDAPCAGMPSGHQLNIASEEFRSTKPTIMIGCFACGARWEFAREELADEAGRFDIIGVTQTIDRLIREGHQPMR